MLHARAGCRRASSQAKAGASPRAGLLLFLLEDVAQRTLAGAHRVLQRGAQETIGGPPAATRDELQEEMKTKSL